MGLLRDSTRAKADLQPQQHAQHGQPGLQSRARPACTHHGQPVAHCEWQGTAELRQSSTARANRVPAASAMHSLCHFAVGEALGKVKACGGFGIWGGHLQHPVGGVVAAAAQAISQCKRAPPCQSTCHPSRAAAPTHPKQHTPKALLVHHGGPQPSDCSTQELQHTGARDWPCGGSSHSRLTWA